MAIEVTFWGSSLSFLQEEIRRRAMNTGSNFFQPFSESWHVKLNKEREKRSTDVFRANLERGGGGECVWVAWVAVGWRGGWGAGGGGGVWLIVFMVFIFKIMCESTKKRLRLTKILGLGRISKFPSLPHPHLKTGAIDPLLRA